VAEDRFRKNRKLKDRIKIFFLVLLLKTFFLTERFFVKIKSINYPEGQFILSMWHCHQCLVYGIKDKSKFYVLISASNDGEIIAKAAETLGIKSVRGSSKRRAVAASLELIDKIKEGNSAAIMVDGPRGPKGKVKGGIINIAKITGVPIIPVSWMSKDKTFFQFNSWDKFQIPIGLCKTVALYGKPIYIPQDMPKEDEKKWRKKVEKEMNKLEQDLTANYDKYLNS
jgi:hypothetical protein